MSEVQEILWISRSWVFLKANNPVPSGYAQTTAMPHRAGKHRQPSTDDRRPLARHGRGQWQKHRQFMEMRAETAGLQKTQSRTEVPSYFRPTGHDGTLYRPGRATDRPSIVRASACTVQFIQGRPRHRARWRPVQARRPGHGRPLGLWTLAS